MTNLLEVLNYIGSILDVGGQVDAVYLDMSKAFDKVNHKHLLHKLRMAGFGGSLLQWFQSYLTNRHQRVTAQGSTSTTLPFSYPEPFLRAVRRGALAKSITGYHKNMVIEYIRY